jgi:hypothetical protein
MESANILMESWTVLQTSSVAFMEGGGELQINANIRMERWGNFKKSESILGEDEITLCGSIGILRACRQNFAQLLTVFMYFYAKFRIRSKYWANCYL